MAAKKKLASDTPPVWRARPYQQIARDKFHDGLRRQLLIWHRRAGKDSYALNTAADEADKEVGTYWHLYPMHVQARRAIWNGIDNQGIRFIDQAFPPERRVATRIADMQIELDNGSMWQLCGSDAYDRLVGANPRGVVFSEWALCDPRAWDYLRPIMRENNGWAVFITTYRGRNHAYQMAKKLADHPDWFVDIRTVDDTTHQDGRPILTPEDIQAERDEGMSEALIQQEYYCNPMAAPAGAIYGKSLEKLQLSGHTGALTYDSTRPVIASWSLEYDDQYTAIFWQATGNESHVIGSKSFPFAPLSDCLDQVATLFPWRHCSRHVVPYDTSGDAVELFEKHNLEVDHAPKKADTIKVTRDQLARTWIDTARRTWEPDDENNANLLDGLIGYRFSPGKISDTFLNTPMNSWEKHYARAFEVYATWRNSEGDQFGGWHAPASTEIQDMAVI